MGNFFLSPAAFLVCPVTAVPALCGGEQGGGPRSATTHPAGAPADMSGSGPATLPQPHRGDTQQGDGPHTQTQ